MSEHFAKLASEYERLRNHPTPKTACWHMHAVDAQAWHRLIEAVDAGEFPSIPDLGCCVVAVALNEPAADETEEISDVSPGGDVHAAGWEGALRILVEQFPKRFRPDTRRLWEDREIAPPAGKRELGTRYFAALDPIPGGTVADEMDLMLVTRIEACHLLADKHRGPANRAHFVADLTSIQADMTRKAEPAQSGTKNAARGRITKQQAEERVAKYLREQMDSGRQRSEITRDGVAVATGISSGTVSGTEAWQKHIRLKKQEALPDHRPNAAGNPDIDEAIEKGDWDAVRRNQEQEQTRKPRVRR